MILLLSTSVAYVPTTSLAAVTPYFIATNDTLLPFNESTMPFVSGGNILVPDSVFGGVGVWSVSDVDLELVWLYRGNRFVDFNTATGEVQDQDGNILNWPSARRVGRSFYVPVRQVCEHFGLTLQILEVPHNVIPYERMRVIRIVSNSTVSGATFIGQNERALRNAYNDYYTPVAPPPQPPLLPEEPDELPPDYSTITIYLSFFDISAGSAEEILNVLESQVVSNHQTCFFVSADDILMNPDVIRRISGSGHVIGIWLDEGTYEEYLETSALLFEAAKVRTVLVSSDESTETAVLTADEHDLIFWGGSQNIAGHDALTIAGAVAMLPADNDARSNMMFSCSENAALVLPGLYTHLRVNEFMIARINETVEPIV
jgi:hypothetical protein